MTETVTHHEVLDALRAARRARYGELIRSTIFCEDRRPATAILVEVCGNNYALRVACQLALNPFSSAGWYDDDMGVAVYDAAIREEQRSGAAQKYYEETPICCRKGQ